MKSFNYFRLCILTFVIISAGCSKSEVKPATKEFKFKTEAWEVYPYAGGIDEDSAWSSFSPDLPGFAVDILTVRIKEKNGTVLNAEKYNGLGDGGYQYQTGVTDYKLLFWWVQKLPLTKPDADSIFVTFRTK
jgi:hypothetical protein